MQFPFLHALCVVAKNPLGFKVIQVIPGFSKLCYISSVCLSTLHNCVSNVQRGKNLHSFLYRCLPRSFTNGDLSHTTPWKGGALLIQWFGPLWGSLRPLGFSMVPSSVPCCLWCSPREDRCQLRWGCMASTPLPVSRPHLVFDGLRPANSVLPAPWGS